MDGPTIEFRGLNSIYSFGGTYVVIGFKNSIEIWDSSSEKTFDIVKTLQMPLTFVSLSTDRTLIAYISEENLITVWNIKEKKP